ncbi:MAG: ion transporter [Planctomycetota bacterium]
MTEADLVKLLQMTDVSPWRVAMARWVESRRVQGIVIAVILANAVILGLETDAVVRERFGSWLFVADRVCLAAFVAELVMKLVVYRASFWRNGWNWFDAVVVGFALVPGAGPWSVLRSLRVLRVLRLLTVAPQLRKVVAAFLHAIPGLAGVIAVMAVFFYTAGVLATTLFGQTHPQWFGSLGSSLYSLFQVMTLESWSMGIARPVMQEHPWAWAFFVPFIVIATFTILNLFIGIIVSTMQELSQLPDPSQAQHDVMVTLEKLNDSLRELRAQILRDRGPV